MADFDLIQTDAQVQSILNDGQNMQGAGAQTTLTTESVLLKDVNGNYHKILKSSFTEAVRNTLASLLVNNDKGTTISQIAAIASGDFGSVTPANLASVLGVGKTTQTLQSGSSLDIEGIGLLLLDCATGDTEAVYICSFWNFKLIESVGKAPENYYTIAHTGAKTVTITALKDFPLRYKFLQL